MLIRRQLFSCRNGIVLAVSSPSDLLNNSKRYMLPVPSAVGICSFTPVAGGDCHCQSPLTLAVTS